MFLEIFEIGANQYWTGAKRTIGEMEGAPPGWTRTQPPELEPGEFAFWSGEWQVIQTAPRAPAPRVPDVVPMRNAKLALLYAGLLASVEQYIAGMEGMDGDAARIDWVAALTVRRDSPLVASMTELLGKTEEEIDALFIAAEALG